MATFLFITNATITLSTQVKADTLAKAIEIARRRGPQGLCHSCADGDSSKEWVTSGEIDCGDPSAELVDASKDGKDITKQAKKAWDKE